MTQNSMSLSSTKDNQKLSKCLSKEFERSVYWNEYQIKSENKNTIGEYRYFLLSKFAGVKRLFVLTCSNQYDNDKTFKARRYYLPKGITKNYKVIINGNNFYDQHIDSDVKGYRDIRKLTTGQGEYYATWCLLSYACWVKNH